MNKSVKKLLVTGASLLLMMCTGASIKSAYAKALTKSDYGTWYASSTRIPSNWGHLKVYFGHRNDYIISGADKGSYIRTHYDDHYLDWTHGMHNSFRIINHNTIRYNIDTASWNLHRVSNASARKRAIKLRAIDKKIRQVKAYINKTDSQEHRRAIRNKAILYSDIKEEKRLESHLPKFSYNPSTYNGNKFIIKHKGKKYVSPYSPKVAKRFLNQYSKDRNLKSLNGSWYSVSEYGDFGNIVNFKALNSSTANSLIHNIHSIKGYKRITDVINQLRSASIKRTSRNSYLIRERANNIIIKASKHSSKYNNRHHVSLYKIKVYNDPYNKSGLTSMAYIMTFPTPKSYQNKFNYLWKYTPYGFHIS